MHYSLRYKDLNHLQVGKIAEYWTKLILTLYGFDVYNTEVDDKGIDFLVRISNSRFLDIQVKALRLPTSGYVFIPKVNEWTTEKLRDTLYLSLVLFEEAKMPSIFLIPSTKWQSETALLRSNDYGEGYKSKPEWGINLSNKNMHLLEEFEIGRQISQLKAL